jgi:hypothetical protein
MQVNQLLELPASSEEDDKYAALDKWSKSLKTLHSNIVSKLSY